MKSMYNAKLLNIISTIYFCAPFWRDTYQNTLEHVKSALRDGKIHYEINDENYLVLEWQILTKEQLHKYLTHPEFIEGIDSKKGTILYLGKCFSSLPPHKTASRLFRCIKQIAKQHKQIEWICIRFMKSNGLIRFGRIENGRLQLREKPGK